MSAVERVDETAAVRGFIDDDGVFVGVDVLVLDVIVTVTLALALALVSLSGGPCRSPFPLRSFFQLAQGSFDSAAGGLARRRRRRRRHPHHPSRRSLVYATRCKSSGSRATAEERREVALSTLVLSSVHVADDGDEHLVRALLAPADRRHKKAAYGVEVRDAPLEDLGRRIHFRVEIGFCHGRGRKSRREKDASCVPTLPRKK